MSKHQTFLLDTVEENHQYCMEKIRGYLYSFEEYDKESTHLANWIVNNPRLAAPTLPDGWGNSLQSSSDLVGLLSNIHHALVDDGDICFPVYNGQPYISFACQHEFSEEGIHHYIGSQNAELRKPSNPVNVRMKEFRAKHGLVEDPLPEVTFLKDVYEFTGACDSHEASEFKKSFITTVGRGRAKGDTEEVTEYYCCTLGGGISKERVRYLLVEFDKEIFEETKKWSRLWNVTKETAK